MRSILKSFAEDLVSEVKKIFELVGVNEKVGVNTLIDSDLYKDIEFDILDDGTIRLKFNHYIEYIENGRPPQYGKRPPVSAILQWIKKKHIVPSNKNVKTVEQLAFVFSYVIWRDGYKARKILETLYDNADDVFQRNVDWIIDYILYDLTEFFNK